VLINWIVFHQPLTLGQLLGFLLIWFTLWLMSRGKGDDSATVSLKSS